MDPAGRSAEEQYRVRLRRLRLRRTVAGAVCLAGGGASWWILRTRPVAAGGHLALSWGLLGAASAALSVSALVVLMLPGSGAAGRREAERWYLGAVAERRTAEMLSRLSRRWVVRHDLTIPGSRANIDHLVVGRTGVWVVDTKSTTAPVSARWRSVRFGDRRLDTTATRWEAEVVQDRLEAYLRRAGGPGYEPSRSPARTGAVGSIPVRAVVAVHGRGLRRRGGRAGGVPVVPAERLVRRLRRGRRCLGRSEVAAISSAIEHLFPRDAWCRTG